MSFSQRPSIQGKVTFALVLLRRHSCLRSKNRKKRNGNPQFPPLWGGRGAPFRSTPRSAPPPEPAPPSDHAPRLRPRPQGWPHLKPLPTSQPQLAARAPLTHLDAVSAADVLASLSPYPNPHPQADVSARPPREADAFTRAPRPLTGWSAPDNFSRLGSSGKAANRPGSVA